MTESAMREGMAQADPGLAALLHRVESGLNLAGIDIFRDFEEQLQAVEEELCQEEDAPYFQHMVLTYAHCRMTMDTPTHSMEILMPPGSPSATMSAIDLAKGEGVMMDMARDLDRLIPVTGRGWSDGVSMSPTGGVGELLGRPAVHYTFRYDAGMGGSGSQMGWISSMISVTNEGTAWVVDNIPGDSIPRRFYWDLSAQVQPAAGPGSFMSGLIQNMVGMLQYGLPLDIETKTSSKVSGVTTISGHTHSIINDVRLVPKPPGWCNGMSVPADIEMTDINEQMEEAMAGYGGQDQSQMDEAMQQYTEAMQNMTPEQRAMMEQMGLGGDMFGGMPGAGAAGAAAAGSQARAATSAAPATASVSRSKELQSDDPTTTVQNYLTELGYDTGNTSGELSLETIIAISQFQAENGMEATGEVSPQLIGLLAAKVDAN